MDISAYRQGTLDEIVRIINAEIRWCHQHPDMVSKEYQDAFIKGLEQAKYLTAKLAEPED